MKLETAKDVKQMRNKLNLSLFLGLVLTVTIFSVMSVSAITLDLPADGSTVSGNVTINVSAPTTEEMDNCSIYALSASTANSTWSLLGVVTNDTVVNITSGTVDTKTVLEDSSDYQFNATCINATADVAKTPSDATTATIVVDNEVPDAPTSLGPIGVVSNSTFTLFGTVNDAETLGCSIIFVDSIPGSGESTQAGTYSGSSCSLALTNVPEGTYRWYMNATDKTNVTDSSIQTTTIDVQTGGARGAQILLEDGVQIAGEGGMPTGTIVIVVIIIIVVVFIARAKK